MTARRRNTCAPRKRTTSTKAERRLEERVIAFERIGNKEGFTCPGSFKR